VIDISGFGAKIKAERERQGQDLAAIEAETKIRAVYLRALEEEEFSILPPRVYATGFVRRYAKLLKMDPEALVKEFEDLAYKGQPRDEFVQSAEKPSKEIKFPVFNLPIKNIIAGAIFLTIVIWAGNYLITYISGWSITRPPAVNETGIDKAADTKTETPTTDKLVLDIEARERCWLQVLVDGEQKYSAIMAVGEKQTFEARQSIVVKAGNAGGIDVSLNKNKLASLGKSGEVVEKKYDLGSIGKE
jgi:cytoskeletal protein RodZ